MGGRVRSVYENKIHRWTVTGQLAVNWPRTTVLRAIKNLTELTSDPRSGLRSECFDINIAYLRKWAPAGAEKRGKLEPGEIGTQTEAIFSH